jgi:RNA polymerase sigma-70 factor, ECF subfamily
VIPMSRMPSPDEGAAPRFEDALAHADALYNLARHLTRNTADAEDLVQETYTRAVRAWGVRDAGASLAAWLFRILRNAWLDRWRRDRRSPLDADGAEADAAPDSEAWLRNDVELERMRGLVAEEIETALGTLSEDARTVVLLDVEGFTETEVAHVLGCAVGTVKSRLARARAALRARLGEYAHDMGTRP